jgi:transcriptional regulator NrdR family protein
VTFTADVIKAGGREQEPFSRDKLYTSIFTACLSVRASEGSATTAANATCDAVEQWLATHPEVTSHDLRRIAAKTLETHNSEAAYFYIHHKHIV